MEFVLRLLFIVVAVVSSYQVQADVITIPQTRDSSSAFDRVVALYNQAHMPEWSNFDPLKAPHGKVVKKDNPNLLVPFQLISLESGDDVVGSIRRAGQFALNWEDAPVTIEMGQECLIGHGRACFVLLSPLATDLNQNAFVTSAEGINEAYCTSNMFYRKTKLPNGTQVLVSIGIHADKRSECNPTADGEKLGDIVRASYFELR